MYPILVEGTLGVLGCLTVLVRTSGEQTGCWDYLSPARLSTKSLLIPAGEGLELPLSQDLFARSFLSLLVLSSLHPWALRHR